MERRPWPGEPLMRCNKQQMLPFATTDAMVEESISYLKENEPQDGYFVGFSGGKDSICALELCRMAGVKHQVYYSCTRIDPPEIYWFIKRYYPDVIWLFPKESFYQAIQHKSPPLRISRWCCDLLKKDPSKKVPLNKRVVGIRTEESTGRSSRPRTDYFKKYRQTLFKPIFHWKEYHVWEFIDGMSLSYPTLYDEGFSRIGCVGCPFQMGKSSAKIKVREISMGRWPGIWKELRHSCLRWFANLDGTQKHKSFDEYWKAYLNGFE